MNRKLQFVNMFGVVALTALCVFQWRQNRELNLDRNELEKTRQALALKLTEQEKHLGGLTADLAHFKAQFTQTKTELTAVREKWNATEQTLALVNTERDQLQASLTNWMKAVVERDAKLQEANDRIRDLAEQLNASVVKFNELVTNYNETVKVLNSIRPAPQPES